MQHPSMANSVSAVMLPTGHMTTEPRKPWQDDVTYTQYTAAEHHQPHYIHEKSHSYSGSKPAFGKISVCITYIHTTVQLDDQAHDCHIVGYK